MRSSLEVSRTTRSVLKTSRLFRVSYFNMKQGKEQIPESARVLEVETALASAESTVPNLLITIH